MLSQLEMDKLCNEILTLIEFSEERLLNWGFTDIRSDLDANLGSLLEKLPTESRQIWEQACSSGVTVADILDNLVERRLIFKSRQFYRSRFAESIRLLYNLRQRFSVKDWQSASRLVSDLRLQLQRRRYPRRDIDVENLQQELRELNLSDTHLKAVEVLLQSDEGTPLKIARFQKEAIVQIFQNLQGRSQRAVVVGAGTGAGKTKAFYVPAMSEIASSITQDYWVKALALYPRVELLKDQLSEAFREARKLDSLLKQRRQRPLLLGAYYADTPTNAKLFLQYPPSTWEMTAAKDGWVCPFLTCPNSACKNGELVWYKHDLTHEAEANKQGRFGQFARLYCSNCRFEVNSSQFLLTRDQLVKQPPDILFTTTEMLNRRLNRSKEHKLFGIKVASPPRLVLLDEIHTYNGLNGAQIAYLLRRWRQARSGNAQTPLCFVGLSATITQAPEFMAKLTGTPIYHVNYIEPALTDQIEEGVEYNLALKGDPVSGTSLLSTSVQTVMLLARILDKSGKPVSKGAYGHKVFAFTDKLDVINRWFHIEKDAEGEKVLSRYRDLEPGVNDEQRERRSQAGQFWGICKRIGHELQKPLQVDLTSSQYRGVDAKADLVIATSTLEVGYNDPAVGAVIQHKAPRDLASFLQRKGRAGRTRAMRPWTVVVTSAYGRDRWFFQHAENLFNPVLPPIELPLNNYYVQKIQATFCLLDWLALTVKQEKFLDVDVWEILSKGEAYQNKYGTAYQDKNVLQVNAICKLLEAILDGSRLEAFKNYLQRALQLEDDLTLKLILWGEPRSLLFEVIPTLLRQLESRWQGMVNLQPQKWKDKIADSPLPEFLPPNLFTELNLPELVLQIPDKPNGTELRDDVYMALLPALVEFAPGNVTKRFARSHLKLESHWLLLPSPDEPTGGKIELSQLNIQRSATPSILTLDESEYYIFQPRSYRLEIVPKNVKISSTGRLLWRSHFEPLNQLGQAVESLDLANVREFSPVTNRLLKSIRAYTQANGDWVAITRMAIGVEGQTRYEADDPRNFKLEFTDNGQPAALGFTVYADALRFEFMPLATDELFAKPNWRELYKPLAADYFLYKLRRHPLLAKAELTKFEIEWLWQLELSMLAAVAIASQVSLTQAAAEVEKNRQALANRTLKVIFQSQQASEQETDNWDDADGFLQKKLLGYLSKPDIQEALRDCREVLWSQPTPDLADWLKQVYAASLGTTFFAALTQIVPDIDPADLVLDVLEAENSIWISEAVGGGVGIISKMAEALSLRPREFDLQLRYVLQNCSRARLADQLQNVAVLIGQNNPDLSSVFGALRTELELNAHADTQRQLVSVLEKNGIAVTRELIVALNTKFLRPNSAADTDELIQNVAEQWRTEEERLSCAIDLRVMAVAARRIPDIEGRVQQVLQRIGGLDVEQTPDENQIFNLLQSLLWINCHSSCSECIEKQPPFQELEKASRPLLLSLLTSNRLTVRFGASGWEDALRQTLSTAYEVRLTCEQSQLAQCKTALLKFLTEPVEVGFQLFYPVIETLERVGQEWQINLLVKEMLHG
jgi:hypothetical protein